MQPYLFFENITVEMINSYDKFNFQFKLNDILVIMGFCKLYIILRVILTSTVYMSPRCKYLYIQLVDYAECMDVNQIIYILSNVYSKIHHCYL